MAAKKLRTSRIATLLLTIVPARDEGYPAEVTVGGVDTASCPPRQFRADGCRAHFIGEAVDATGWLGDSLHGLTVPMPQEPRYSGVPPHSVPERSRMPPGSWCRPESHRG